jgi:hypothetical protein
VFVQVKVKKQNKKTKQKNKKQIARDFLIDLELLQWLRRNSPHLEKWSRVQCMHHTLALPRTNPQLPNQATRLPPATLLPFSQMRLVRGDL